MTRRVSSRWNSKGPVRLWSLLSTTAQLRSQGRGYRIHSYVLRCSADVQHDTHLYCNTVKICPKSRYRLSTVLSHAIKQTTFWKLSPCAHVRLYLTLTNRRVSAWSSGRLAVDGEQGRAAGEILAASSFSNYPGGTTARRRQGHKATEAVESDRSPLAVEEDCRYCCHYWGAYGACLRW